LGTSAAPGSHGFGDQVIADPRTGQVRQPFAVCFHARPLSGSPGGNQAETSDARWFTLGDIPALARPGGAWELRWLLPHLPVTTSVIWRCSTTGVAST